MNGVTDIVNQKIALFMSNIVAPVVWLLIGVAVVMFIYGIWEHFFKDTDGAERAKGARHILWGVVGFAIMMSAMGIINIILNTAGGSRANDEFGTEYKERTPLNINFDGK